MQKQISKSPEIRFKKYTDRWGICKLGVISNKVTEKNKENMYKETLTNSAEHGIINQRDFFDKDISNEKNLNNYYVVRPDDFVYNPRISSFAPVGPIKRNKLGRIGVMSPLYHVFRTRDVNVSFLEIYFSTSKWHRFMKMNGDSGARSDRFAIKDTVFREMPIPIPSSKEQAEIGNFYKHLDENIILQQHKIELLQKSKKSLLQKMFPEKGEKVPEVRFPGFTEDWEQRKFSDVIKSHSSRPYFAEPIEIGEYEVIQQGDNPVLGYSGGEPFEDFEDVILFGDHTVSLYKPTKPFFVATDGVKILSGDGFDGKYFYSTLERYKPESQGYKRHFTILKKEDVWFTRNRDEQQKIGSFFKNLDNLITLHQGKLNSLKEFKKTMLQKMFI